MDCYGIRLTITCTLRAQATAFNENRCAMSRMLAAAAFSHGPRSKCADLSEMLPSQTI
ncbi:hypothetical protein CLOSYM_01796 [[Clostridium] symbiosum ATCC 14940]|uniref:Uncharacterized protein n=1 Tax=[Clostridium] symbiosum ATCC 14940 TaxID=411472 RepID=A0ABC9TZE6_CLOSY|nr:hypothetical protein CLOSYM_01796 [[Clostridium] symbiosum ATCC 14940]